MSFNVRSIIGSEDAITLDDGQAVYNRIYPELKAGRSIELDFAGVDVFASPFFNAAIGQLLRDLDPDQLNRLFHVANLSGLGNSVLRQVVANSKKYYSDPRYKAAVDQVMSELSEEH